MPLSDDELGTTDFYRALKHDKKIKQQQLTMIYLKKIGQPEFYCCPIKQVIGWLQQELPQKKS